MKLPAVLLFLLLMTSCLNTARNRKAQAVALNTKIITLTNHTDNHDSCRKAIAYLDSATSIDNSCFSCYMNKPMFLVPLKEYRKAIEAMDNCIRLSSGSADLYMSRGILYEKAGDTNAAIRSWNTSLELSNKVLDTMYTNTMQYVMLSVNKGVTQILLGDTIAGHHVLVEQYKSLIVAGREAPPEAVFIRTLLDQNKAMLMKFFETPAFISDTKEN